MWLIMGPLLNDPDNEIPPLLGHWILDKIFEPFIQVS